MLDCIAAAARRPGSAAGVPAGRQPLRLDHGARPEDRRDPLGDASDRLRRLDGRLHPVPSATAPTAPSRPGPTSTSARRRRYSRSGTARHDHVTSSGPDRRAASTGRSIPTPVPCAGSPRPAPAERPAACSGARPSTASVSTPPTPTATRSPWTLPDGASRPTACGAASTPSPARCCGRRVPTFGGASSVAPPPDR